MKRQNGLTGWVAMLGFLGVFTFWTQTDLLASSKATFRPDSGVQLIMFEQDGCHYCEVWDANIGGSYHKTDEGKFAPLKKVDIHTDDDVPNVKPVVFTPTFVLYKGGKEVGRLTGYISDDFFWGLLGPMLKKHGYGKKDSKIKASELQGAD